MNKNSTTTILSKVTIILMVTFLFLINPKSSYAAVAYEATSESHTGTTPSTSETSFNWSHSGGASPEGVVVFVYTIASTGSDTGVNYGASAMSLVSGGAASDTATEPGTVRTYFLGTSVPTGSQTVTVNRTNNSNEMYAVAFTVNAGDDTAVYTAGIVLLQENGAIAEQNVDDGSPGTNSVRFAGAYDGRPAPPTAGSNSTLAHDIDLGAYGIATAYETTAGQGSRPVGLVIANDDRAVVHLAVYETVPTFNFSGVIRQTNESSTYDCSTGGPYTVRLRVNGTGSYTADCDQSSGAWAITDVTVTSGQTIYVYIYNETPKGSVVLVSDASTLTDVDIFQDRVVLRDDVNASITNTEVLAGNTADADDLITTSGTDVTVGSTYETHIYTSDTYAPGADVNTGKLHVVGTYSGNTETLTLTASGTGTSRPLYVNGGTFTDPTTTTFTGTSATDIEATTYTDLNFTPTITGAVTYTLLGAVTTDGDFTINPTASTTQILTVNAGGTITVASGKTTTITGTTSGESVLDLRPSSTDYNLTTGLLNIAAAGTLDLTGATSTITLNSTSGTLFTLTGTFTAGSSTVIFNPDEAVTLFSATPTLYNLSLTPTITAGRIYTVGSALTINNDFTINPGTAANLLTVNMGGHITVTGTTTVTKTTSATSLLDLRPSSTDYNLTTGLLNIATGATVDADSAASNVTLTGTSGTLFTLAGTFTSGSSTVIFNPDAAVTLFSATPTLNNLSLTPTITAGRVYTVGAALTINGDFTINPTADSALDLTVDAGGHITGVATTTTTITGTTSGTSTLDLRPVTTDYDLTTGLLDIASAGTLDLDSAASTITLNATSGTLFTRVGTFTEGSSTVTVTSDSAVTFNSGTVTFYNLTINPTNDVITTATDDITVSNTLNVSTGDTLSLASGQNLTHSGTTLTLDGTISGSGTIIYQSATAFPTSGSITSGLRMDSTNGDQTLSGGITYGGDVEFYNNSGASARNIVLGSGTTTFSGNVTLNAANSQSLTLTGSANNPVINITGNLDSTSGSGTEDITTGTGTWTISGNVDFTDIGTFTSTNTFAMDGATKTLTSAGESFNNFSATGGSISTLDAMTVSANFLTSGSATFNHDVGIMDVNGTFDLSGTATFVHGAGADIDITIAGDFTLASGTTWTENVTASSQVTFDGDIDYADNNGTKQSIGNVIIGTSPDTTNLTTDYSSNSLTVSAGDYFNTCEYEVNIGNGGLVVNGIFDNSDTGNDGSVDQCGAGNEGDETTINDANSFTINSGATYVADASTLIMDDGAGTDDLITDGSFSLYNLEINTGGTIEVEDDLDVDNNLTITAGTLDVVTGENNQITVGGNWVNNATFAEQSGKVLLDGTTSTTLDSGCADFATCTAENFYDLEIDKSDGGDANDNVTITATDIRATNTITITDGELIQGALNVRAEGTTAINIISAGEWTNESTGDITLGGTLANAGTITLDGTSAGCGGADAILLRSTAAAQRSWNGSGTFNITDVDAEYQTGAAAITAYSSTNTGNNGGNWNFVNCQITVSGTVRDFGTSNALTECDASGATFEIHARIAGTTQTASCDDGTGAFTFSSVPGPDTGDGIIFWIDDSVVSGTDGSMVTRYDGTGDSTNNIFYDDAVTIMSDDTTAVDILDMNFYDNADDADIPYTATDATPDTLSINSGYELLISLKSGVANDSTVFDPNGTVTTNATGGDLHLEANTTAYLDTATNSIGRDIEVDNSATLNIDADTTIAGGDIITAGTGATVTTSTGTPNITMTATGAIGGGTTPTLTFYDFTTSGTGTTTISNTTTVNNDISIGAGTTLTIAANLNIDGGDLITTTTGVINYTGTPTLDLDATGTLGGGSGNITFYNLDLGDGTSDTTTLASDIIIENTLTNNTNQTFAMGTNDVAVGATSVSGSGDITNNGATSQSASGTFTIKSSASGTATLDGSGTLTVYNLTLGDGATAITVDNETNDVVLEISNNFTNTANSTFQASTTGAFQIANNYSNSGTFTSGSGTVTMDGQDAGNTLSGTMTGSSSFYNLTFNDAGTSGAWNFGANSADVTNNFAITGGTVTAPSTTLTIGANFDNSDGFTHASGTVVFNDATKTSKLTYSATTTFNDFTVSTGGKAMQFESTDTVITDIDGTLTIQGTDCTTGRIFLDSEINDATWDIAASGTVDIDYVDIEDSIASPTLTSESSTEDNNNNTGWTVNTGACGPKQTNVFNGVRMFSGVVIK